MKIVSSRDRQGFSLIELVVVLMILIGLAGVLIPAVSNMVPRTHLSTCSSNISQVSNALQRYETETFSYPANLDSLVTDIGAGTALNTLDDELTDAANITNVTLDADTAAALVEAVGTVSIHAVDDATFQLPTPGTVPAATNILLGPSVALQAALGLDNNGVAGRYVYLGVGAASAMNGVTMVDAPVHFPENAEGNPAVTYSRFLAIFQLSRAVGATEEAFERARFVGTISPHGEGLGAEIGEFFEITGTGNN